MYVVTGATGNTGRVVANRLLDQGKKVRVIGRNRERLQPFVARGAEAFVADLSDQTAVKQAFAGANAVYAMIPPDVASPGSSRSAGPRNRGNCGSAGARRSNARRYTQQHWCGQGIRHRTGRGTA